MNMMKILEFIPIFFYLLRPQQAPVMLQLHEESIESFGPNSYVFSHVVD